ncbi:MAG TPA: DUF3299 domain-containing protein [Burkholderiales bacterium]|nr:DUF3299 domain-containing protein [Burkholderiales bacterium]
MRRLYFFLASIIVACLLLTGQKPSFAASGEKGDYRVGDRLSQPKSPNARSTYKEIKWDDLIPPGWDPSRLFKDMDLSKLTDADPRATEVLQRVREEWDKAPIRADMNGARIRIPGFIVPLERNGDHITEFLLVPYFGACIHTPPPPANQIIHVVAAKPLKGVGSMEPVWVNGAIETTRSDTSMGNAGYRMNADVVSAYK